MTAGLNTLIQKTFIDDAIHSAIVIDDQFHTYESLFSAHKAGEVFSADLLKDSERSLSFERFFSSKKILCNIDNGVSVIENVDKLKKSDLIVIDYYLNGSDPDITLRVLNAIKDSDNLNFVVVYTNENLNDALLDVATTFRGVSKFDIPLNKLIDDEFELESIWHGIADDIDSGNMLSSDSELRSAIRNDEEFVKNKKKVIADIRVRLNDAAIDTKYASDLCGFAIEYALSAYNKINSDLKGDLNVKISSNNAYWVQSNNIFVCFYNKTVNTDEAKEVWDVLSTSILDWNPTYYQTLVSEMQNVIESKSFSFIRPLLNDPFSQAAWLSEILKNKEKSTDQIDLIFNMFTESVNNEMKTNQKLNEFIGELVGYIYDEYKKSESNEVDFSKLHHKLPNGDHAKKMYHALNMDLSSTNYQKGHITTGTVFKTVVDGGNPDWYLCVSAACDMVPSQNGAAFLSRMQPHKLIKAIRLINAAFNDETFKNLTNSNFVFILDEGERKIFNIYKDKLNGIDIDYLIVKNVNDSDKIMDAALIKYSDADDLHFENIKIKLKSQLRTGYAERFQNFASNQSARIGVDFIPLKQ